MSRFAVSEHEKVLEKWLMLFFLFSAAGWVWEVLLTACTTGQWVNRGMLHGPWLPVYGAGGVLLAAVLGKLEKMSLVVCLAAVIGGAVEYGTALVLEALYRQRWWDYTGAVGSIHGRVCLASLTGFAFAGWLAVQAAPEVMRWFEQIPGSLRTVFCRCVSFLFALDWALSLVRPNMGYGISIPL